MPRTARQKSESGIYHIMLRGADRRIIFSDDEDCTKFIETVARAKEISGFQLYAYCLMGNHVHMLLREGAEPLEKIFKRIGTSYVYYYNRKYDLYGHLFQDRFRSEQVDGDAYFESLLRYIFQNPMKAGLCEDPRDYPWLKISGIHTDPLLDGTAELTDLSGERLLQFVSSPGGEGHLEYEAPKRLSDRDAIGILCGKCRCRYVQEIGSWDDVRKAAAIKTGYANGISIRQLSRITGISKAVIERVLKEE